MLEPVPFKQSTANCSLQPMAYRNASAIHLTFLLFQELQEKLFEQLWAFPTVDGNILKWVLENFRPTPPPCNGGWKRERGRTLRKVGNGCPSANGQVSVLLDTQVFWSLS